MVSAGYAQRRVVEDLLGNFEFLDLRDGLVELIADIDDDFGVGDILLAFKTDPEKPEQPLGSFESLVELRDAVVKAIKDGSNLTIVRTIWDPVADRMPLLMHNWRAAWQKLDEHYVADRGRVNRAVRIYFRGPGSGTCFDDLPPVEELLAGYAAAPEDYPGIGGDHADSDALERQLIEKWLHDQGKYFGPDTIEEIVDDLAFFAEDPSSLEGLLDGSGIRRQQVTARCKNSKRSQKTSDARAPAGLSGEITADDVRKASAGTRKGRNARDPPPLRGRRVDCHHHLYDGGR